MFQLHWNDLNFTDDFMNICIVKANEDLMENICEICKMTELDQLYYCLYQILHNISEGRVLPESTDPYL